MEKKHQNWHLIKSDYMAGMSLDQISRKYVIPIETLRTRIKRGKWAEEKKQLASEALLKVKDTYVNCLVEHQVRARDRYINYYIEASRKIMEMVESCQDPKQLVLIMNALDQCQSGEFRALAITDKSNQNLYYYVDHWEKTDVTQQSTHVIDKALEALKNDNSGIMNFFVKIVDYALLKGVDIKALMEKRSVDDVSVENKPEERH